MSRRVAGGTSDCSGLGAATADSSTSRSSTPRARWCCSSTPGTLTSTPTSATRTGGPMATASSCGSSSMTSPPPSSGLARWVRRSSRARASIPAPTIARSGCAIPTATWSSSPAPTVTSDGHGRRAPARGRLRSLPRQAPDALVPRGRHLLDRRVRRMRRAHGGLALARHHAPARTPRANAGPPARRGSLPGGRVLRGRPHAQHSRPLPRAREAQGRLFRDAPTVAREAPGRDGRIGRRFDTIDLRGACMQLGPKRFADAIALFPRGRIDHSTADDFRSALAPHLTGGDRLVLDLSGVEYISSVGLRVLILASKQVKKQGGALAVCGLQPVVREIFEISRFNLVLDVFPVLREALARLSPPALAVFDTV